MKSKQRDKWLDITASEVMDSEGARFLIELAVGLVKDEIGEPQSVLCVGSSDGTELDMFKNARGIDLNDESIEKCRQKGFLVDKMDMHDMSYEDNKFQLVFSRDVFEHSIAHIESLSEMARVSGEYVCIVMPDESWDNSDWHFIIPNLRQMVSMAHKVGLMLVAYNEYSAVIGRASVHQHFYLFKKK